MAQRRNCKKWLWWGSVVVLIAAVAIVVGVIVAQQSGKNDNTNNVGNTSETSKIEETKDANTAEAENAELIKAQGEKQKVVQYEGEDPNELDELTGVITYAGVNGENLMIRVSIDQYLTGGSCELTLTRAGATIYNSIASIVGDVATATCKGFDIPVAELGGGNIEISIKLSADSKNGVIRGEASI